MAYTDKKWSTPCEGPDCPRCAVIEEVHKVLVTRDIGPRQALELFGLRRGTQEDLQAIQVVYDRHELTAHQRDSVNEHIVNIALSYLDSELAKAMPQLMDLVREMGGQAAHVKVEPGKTTETEVRTELTRQGLSMDVLERTLQKLRLEGTIRVDKEHLN